MDNEMQPEKPRPETAIRSSWALTGLFVMAAFYTVYLMRSFLLPVVLALILTYVLAPVVRILSRGWIPRPLAAALVVGSLLVLIGTMGSRLIEPAANWMETAPYSLHELQHKVRPLKRPMEKVNKATKEIEKITEVHDEEKPEVVEVKSEGLAERIAKQTPALLASVVTMIILLYFMLAYEEAFLRNAVRALPTLSDKKQAIHIARDINTHVSRYLLTISAINFCLGFAVGVAMALLGMPNPVFWGALACLLNYVPYLGAITGIVVLGLAAVVSFESLGHALVFPAVYFLLTSMEGHFITPMILGRSFTLNPIILVVGLLFWTWLWGIPGTLLAVPILVTFRIFCDHVEALAPAREIMSG